MDITTVTREAVEKAVGERMERITVRDEAGQYWTRDGDAWTAGEGATGDGPAGRLEVPVLHLPIPDKEDEPRLDPPPKTGDGDGPRAPVVETVARSVAALAEAYREGQQSARAAESSARDRLLVDREGSVWAPGLKSGTWYAWRGKTWTRQDGPPEAERLVRGSPGPHACPSCQARVDEEAPCPSCGAGAPALLADTPEAAEALARFLERSAPPGLPEPVASPWDPPKA